jgi:hypothetical protein
VQSVPVVVMVMVVLAGKAAGPATRAAFVNRCCHGDAAAAWRCVVLGRHR